MGIDMADSDQLIGYVKTTDEIRNHIGADSLAYLSHEGMMRAVRQEAAGPGGHCHACFSGDYPIELGSYWESRDKHAFAGAWSTSGDTS